MAATTTPISSARNTASWRARGNIPTGSYTGPRLAEFASSRAVDEHRNARRNDRARRDVIWRERTCACSPWRGVLATLPRAFRWSATVGSMGLTSCAPATVERRHKSRSRRRVSRRPIQPESNRDEDGSDDHRLHCQRLRVVEKRHAESLESHLELPKPGTEPAAPDGANHPRQQDGGDPAASENCGDPRTTTSNPLDHPTHQEVLRERCVEMGRCCRGGDDDDDFPDCKMLLIHDSDPDRFRFAPATC